MSSSLRHQLCGYLIADSPLTCVVEGTGVLLDNIKLLEEN